MKKSYGLLSLMLIGSVYLFGQSQLENLMEQEIFVPSVQVNSIMTQKVKVKNSKAPGDTLYYEDFAGQIPSGWTWVSNVSGLDWQWSTTGPSGQYSSVTGPLPSTTTNNGFMLLDIDAFYTPTPTTGFTPVDVSLQSPALSIISAPSVILTVEQNMRYCCNPTKPFTLAVSSDGINWTEYDPNSGRSPSTTASTNPELFTVDVSSTLANQTTAYFRFEVSQLQSYFWMIDDLRLIEGVSNSLEVTDKTIVLEDTNAFNPIYTVLPIGLTSDFAPVATVNNGGANPQTGLKATAQIYRDSSLSGVPDGTIQYQQVDSSVQILQPSQSHIYNFSNQYFNPGLLGYYTSRVAVTSDSINQTPNLGSAEYKFVVSDTTWARDRNQFSLSSGPASFVNGGNIGDRWAVSYLSSGNAFIPFEFTSVQIFVPPSSALVGAQILAKIWQVDLAGGISTTNMSSALGPRAINAADLGKWITIPVAQMYIFPNTRYGIGWEQLNNITFEAGRDLTMENISPPVSNFVYVNDATPSWGWTNQVLGIRAKVSFLSNLSVNGYEDNKVEIFPNPSSGLMKINLNGFKPDRLRVFDINGKLIFNESSSQKNIMELDLSSFGKGIYFINVSKSTESISKKVVIH